MTRVFQPSPIPTRPLDDATTKVTQAMSAIRNIRIGKRLTLAFGVILLILAACAAAGVWRLQGLAATTRT
ncbi:MAG: methyl-accepting chemotaxis protein, partial [Rhodoferax sp.]|nr:methyl-accepting chemotaxis protein [Rhodoferax sp.]